MTDPSFAMLHGLYWLAANLALRRPTLITVDDLHWADAPSLRWIAYLTRRLEGLPLLLAVATRPPEQSPQSVLLIEVLTDPDAVVVRPGPLRTGAVTALVWWACSAEPAPAFVSACETATEGNPLFLRGLLDALVRDRVLPSAENAARVLKTGPEDVARAVALRLARLPSEMTALMRAAAVLGDGQPLHRVGELAGLDVETAGLAATTLVRSDLLRQEDPVEFVHPIVRTAIVAEMGAIDRARAHRHAGQLLIEAGGPIEQAAAHLVLTSPANDTFIRTILVQAADWSLARGAPQPAVRYLRRALDESPSQAERAEMLHALGIAEFRAAMPGAAGHLGEALSLVGDPIRRSEIALEHAVALALLNRTTAALAVLRRAIGELGAREPQLSLRLEAVLIDFATWDAATNDAAVKRMSALNESSLGHGPGPGVLRAVMAFHEARLGTSRERCVALAKRSLEEGLLSRSAAGLEGLEGLQAIFALICTEEVELVTRAIGDSLRDARHRGDVVTAAHLLLYRAMVTLQRGDLLDAEEDLRSAELDLAATASLELFRVGYLAMVLIERGEAEAAERLLDAVRWGDEITTSFRIPCLYARARLDSEKGMTEAAIAGFRAVGELLESTDFHSPAWFPWRSQAALALHVLGRGAEARELARVEVQLGRRWAAPRTLGVSLRALGLVETETAGEPILREAVDVLGSSHAKLEHARALVDLGAMLRRANRRRDAQVLLRRGLDMAYRAGGAGVVRQAQEELSALGARPRKLVLTGLEALTGSEHRVARMAADGMTNKEIAQALFVTVKAVEVHLTNAYRKLEIRSRAQLSEALAASVPRGEGHPGEGASEA